MRSAPSWRRPPGELRSAATPRLQWVISLRPPHGSTPAGMLNWLDFLTGQIDVTPAQLTEREARLSASDPINIQYTSGTTGRPKGAMLSHRNILLNAYYAGVNQRMDHRDRLCIPVPLYHC